MSLGFDGVTFGYRRRRPVLSDFSLELGPGVTVLLGPNGAGKSTVLSLAAGVLIPWSGSVSIRGSISDRRRDRSRYRRQVGWMSQQIHAMPGFTAREQVAYAGWLKGLSRAEAWERANGTLERVGLTQSVTTAAAHLSGGQLRRVGVAQALVAGPDLLVMDEPTAGLDPAQRSAFRRLLRGLADQVDVLISTHQTDDLEEAADTVVVLSGGAIRWSGSSGAFLVLAEGPEPASRRAEAAYAHVLGRDGW